MSEYERELGALRARINAVDEEILTLLGKRFSICADVAEIKAAHDIPVILPDRIEAVKESRAEFGDHHGLRPDFVRALYETIIDETCKMESGIVDR